MRAGSEAAAIRRVGVLRDIRAAGVGQRNDIGLCVGVVADVAVVAGDLVGEVVAMDVGRRDLSGRRGVAQDTLHAALDVENVAGLNAVHLAADAPSQRVVTVFDAFGS